MRTGYYVALFAATVNAAPAIITRYHTADAVTEWVTYTTNTVMKTNIVVATVNGPPPNAAAATVESSSTAIETPSATEILTPTSTPTADTTVAQTTPTTLATSTATPATESSASTPTTTSTPTTSTPTTTSVPTTTSPTTTSTPTTATPTTSTPATTSTPTTTSSTSTPNTPTTSTTSTTPTTTSTSTSATPTSTSESSTSTSTTSTSSTPTTTSESTSTSSSTSSTSASATTSSGLTSFETDILNEHNIKRALHGVPDLEWNTTLVDYAASYAARAFLCDNVQLIHSGGPYGENLAAGYVGGKDPVDAWYDEIKYYNYSEPGFSEATGHFTQVIWKSTTQLGCAMVTCDNIWRQYTICEYSTTRGNIIGTLPNGETYFQANVLPLVS